MVELIVPALADRREDILPLARHFANQFANRQVRLSPQSPQAIVTHSWTGNVRELRNAIQRARLLCRGDVILPDNVPANIASELTADLPVRTIPRSATARQERGRQWGTVSFRVRQVLWLRLSDHAVFHFVGRIEDIK
ncbi:hypothetical protein [Rubripirellula tenax]